MDFCIPKEILGASANIVIRGDECVLSHTIPQDCWIIGGTRLPHCANTICEIYGMPLPNIYTKSEGRTFSDLGKNPSTVPWIHVLGMELIKLRIDNISSHLKEALEASSRKSYNDIYVDTRRLLGVLSPSRVCVNTLDRFLASESNSSLKTCLQTFRPKAKDMSDPIVYNQAGTSTGRLTVKSGPSILTLPSRYRKILKSRYRGGKIISIDFKSLEPRVALAVRNRKAPEDIYNHISKNILKDESSRDVAKLATIAALYGISFKKFREMSACNDRSVLDKVKDFFAVKAMEKSLRSGEFKNFWGRPLDQETLPHVRISHFIQSTSCDTVNVGFWNFLQLLDEKNIEVTPIFVLHDALILDAPSESIPKIKNLCKNGLKTPLGNFPTTCEKF